MTSPKLTQKLKELYKVQKSLRDWVSEKNELMRGVEELIVEGGLHDQKIEVGGDACFCYKKKKVVGSISQKLLKDRLKEYFGDNEDPEELYQFILDGRKVEEKYQLDTTWKKK